MKPRIVMEGNKDLAKLAFPWAVKKFNYLNSEAGDTLLTRTIETEWGVVRFVYGGKDSELYKIHVVSPFPEKPLVKEEGIERKPFTVPTEEVSIKIPSIEIPPWESEREKPIFEFEESEIVVGVPFFLGDSTAIDGESNWWDRDWGGIIFYKLDLSDVVEFNTDMTEEIFKGLYEPWKDEYVTGSGRGNHPDNITEGYSNFIGESVISGDYSYQLYNPWNTGYVIRDHVVDPYSNDRNVTGQHPYGGGEVVVKTIWDGGWVWRLAGSTLQGDAALRFALEGFSETYNWLGTGSVDWLWYGGAYSWEGEKFSDHTWPDYTASALIYTSEHFFLFQPQYRKVITKYIPVSDIDDYGNIRYYDTRVETIPVDISNKEADICVSGERFDIRNYLTNPQGFYSTGDSNSWPGGGFGWSGSGTWMYKFGEGDLRRTIISVCKGVWEWKSAFPSEGNSNPSEHLRRFIITAIDSPGDLGQGKQVYLLEGSEEGVMSQSDYDIDSGGESDFPRDSEFLDFSTLRFGPEKKQLYAGFKWDDRGNKQTVSHYLYKWAEGSFLPDIYLGPMLWRRDPINQISRRE